jgi:hypothetical protein
MQPWLNGFLAPLDLHAAHVIGKLGAKSINCRAGPYKTLRILPDRHVSRNRSHYSRLPENESDTGSFALERRLSRQVSLGFLTKSNEAEEA